IGLREREPTEIYRLFQMYPDRLQAIVLLGAEVGLQLALPGLPRLQGQKGNLEGYLRHIGWLGRLTVWLAALGLDQQHARALRDQGGQVPLALEPDPLARSREIRALRQHLAVDRPVGQAHHPDGVLTLKLLGSVLRRLRGCGPPDLNLRALRYRLAVLHLEAMVDHVAVGVEPKRLGDAQPEAVLAGQHDLAGRRRRAQRELVRRDHEADRSRRLARPEHREPTRQQPALDDERLLASVPQLPAEEPAARAVDLRVIERPINLRGALRYGGRVPGWDRRRSGDAPRGRCVRRLRGWGGDLGLLGRPLRLGFVPHEDRRVDHQQRGHQEQRQRRPFVHYPLDRLGGGSYPPGFHGWQRASRRTASAAPRTSPCSLS